MHVSVAWLNRLLDRPVTPDEAEHVLTHVGFPIETREAVGDGDTMLDVEVTSNRGDVLSHVGCAREIAAATGRKVVMPRVELPGGGTGEAASKALRLENRTPEACPRFTARVIRGVKFGPSPAWMVAALESVGQRSINNVVDVTNYVNFEYGQPSHVFDLKKLAGAALIVRFASEGEKLRTLDDKARTLKATDLVVADAERAQSLAGVIGGADSEVDTSTTDVVLEAATWDPVTIRTAARRLGIRTDASHRFERRVHPTTIDEPAARAAALILELAGGTLCDGMLDEGGARPAVRTVSMRTERCRMMLGYALPDAEMISIMEALGLGVKAEARTLACTIPPHRLDLEREIDLIEEVARIAGYEKIPTLDTLPVRARAAQRTESVRQRIAGVLTGMGFYETVTFSFVRPADAADFLPPGMARIDVDDERRGEEPTLRPSVVPSLLRCRRANQDGQVDQPGGVRLFEVSSVFAGTQAESGKAGDASSPTHAEHRNLALLMDVPGTGRKRSQDDVQAAMRVLRGAIDQVVGAAGLLPSTITLKPMTPEWTVHPACDPASSAGVMLGEKPLGYMALLSASAQKKHDLDVPVVYAELGMHVLEGQAAPLREVRPLPAFPAIERDLSIVVDEAARWAEVERIVGQAGLDLFEALSYVTTYRDPAKVGKGRKSLTLRVRFRAPDRTLRSEEADAPIASLVERFERELGATLRA
ncbi:MAG: phenylalanine--tRNA ligase subunit beta [Phycisphaerales bacterium]